MTLIFHQHHPPPRSQSSLPHPHSPHSE